MKFVLYVALAVIAFAGVIVAALAATGNLNEEGLRKIIDPQPPAPAEGGDDELDALARALKDREEELNERERQLAAREERLARQAAEVEEDVEQVQNTLELIQGQLTQADETREKRLQELSSSLAEMRSRNAAQLIEEMEPEQAAEVLLRMKPDDRGDIMNEMDTGKAYRVTQIMQEEPI
jgi:flagellar motility protein MotE (MotC chaperone)